MEQSEESQGNTGQRATVEWENAGENVWPPCRQVLIARLFPVNGHHGKVIVFRHLGGKKVKREADTPRANASRLSAAREKSCVL